MLVFLPRRGKTKPSRPAHARSESRRDPELAVLPTPSLAEPSPWVSARGAPPSPHVFSFIFGARNQGINQRRRARPPRQWRRRAGEEKAGRPAAVKPPRHTRAVRSRSNGTEKKIPVRRTFAKETPVIGEINPRSLAVLEECVSRLRKLIFVRLRLNTLSVIYSFAINFIMLIKYSF